MNYPLSMNNPLSQYSPLRQIQFGLTALQIGFDFTASNSSLYDKTLSATTSAIFSVSLPSSLRFTLLKGATLVGAANVVYKSIVDSPYTQWAENKASEVRSGVLTGLISFSVDIITFAGLTQIQSIYNPTNEQKNRQESIISTVLSLTTLLSSHFGYNELARRYNQIDFFSLQHLTANIVSTFSLWHFCLTTLNK